MPYLSILLWHGRNLTSTTLSFFFFFHLFAHSLFYCFGYWTPSPLLNYHFTAVFWDIRSAFLCMTSPLWPFLQLPERCQPPHSLFIITKTLVFIPAHVSVSCPPVSTLSDLGVGYLLCKVTLLSYGDSLKIMHTFCISSLSLSILFIFESGVMPCVRQHLFKII